MRIPIVKDGFRFILPLGLLTAACLVFSMVWGAWVFGLLFLFCTWFFRDPERPLPHDPKAVLSPADGKIVEVKREKDPLLDQPVQRISIFLSVFNVHVNRIPIHGRIEK
ncbi:MAG: phosphatidylserine decarboxylase family protein, partial [Nitrospinaceae bacterium]|nr:phosphatidylserine decarboxylase family protein [Nitrospinaceae bacterium]NIR57956.1 phosphatidylserine decarboxylase family protein [Nitrospinaceae bacterium]NIS88421.1 phosphatidylserine decarboxylase family protein [Nitrospinaceae bacterium]NIT85294.1 phosphatidylserine decarboxylase family protein [Nitrospinaceae bacterium]NIU47452.1 phosphatidylserine decarboxylase family protein [Nitrospinaceae bacterium]